MTREGKKDLEEDESEKPRQETLKDQNDGQLSNVTERSTKFRKLQGPLHLHPAGLHPLCCTTFSEAAGVQSRGPRGIVPSV